MPESPPKPYRSPKQRANALFKRKLADALQAGRTGPWRKLPYLGKPKGSRRKSTRRTQGSG